MCGIIGSVSINESNEKDWINNGSLKMIHRGPDAGGYFKSKSGKVEFGQRRLSIIDLTSASDQPFCIVINEVEYAITFNGEIYNFQEIKKSLAEIGYDFRTDSDTEVILIAYIEWGIDFLKQLEGMFAFAIYDGKVEKVIIARDIVGEKPFYYSFHNGELLFASEFLSIHCHSKFDRVIHSERILEYLELGYLPANKSFCNAINKLEQGRFIQFDIKSGEFIIKEFYSIVKNKPVEKSKDKLKIFDAILDDVIIKEIRSDVSLGVMLSGGIDSSIIACKANEKTKNITNFTVDFGDNSNELANARLISKKYGINHEVLQFSELSLESFCDILDKIDEPIADSSFLPTYLITEKIKAQGCTVVLGGDGADELFGGYSLYKNWIRLSKIAGILPGFAKKTIESSIDHTQKIESKFTKWIKNINYNEKYFPNIREFFTKEELNSLFDKEIDNYGKYYKDQMDNGFDNIENLMIFDLYNYFSSNILLKNDRASMLNSIELRAPFLHKNIVEFAWSNIDLNEKCNFWENKIFLKKYGKTIFPDGYDFHSKRGFNFNNSLGVNKEWRTFFDDSILFLGEKLNWNKSALNNLRQSIFQDQMSFTKVYSLVLLGNWIKINRLNIR